MNIKAELTKEHSKAVTMAIVGYVKNDASKFEELMKLFLGNNYRLCQRASWAVNYCAENHPELVKPYFKKIINNLERMDIHVAVKRNSIRMFQFVSVPENLQGKLVSICFDYLNDVNEAIAVKAFSMTVIFNCCEKYPELLEELKTSIQQMLQLPNASPGLKSHGKKMITAINKFSR